MTEEQWKELRAATLKQWLEKKHPSILQVWEEHFSDVIDLDMWLAEYRSEIEEKFQNYLEREGET